MKNKKNKRIITMMLSLILILSMAITGCSAAKSDEDRWKESENMIDADSVKEETDYSKFEETDTQKQEDQTEEQPLEEAKEEAAKEEQDKGSATQSLETKNEESESKMSMSVKEQSANDNIVEDTKKQTCTISISCSTILSNMENLTEGKESLVPSNGVILGNVKVEFEKGDTVFDVLSKLTRNKRIHMEYVDTPAYNSAYIEGIANLYEKDCGSGSGWMYCVNGWYPDYGCSQYEVENGDVIQWNYTCDLGRDL